VKAATLLHDLRRLAGSARRHLRERRSAAQADLGIAWLQAHGEEPGLPGLRRYSAALTDLGPLPRRLLLTFEVWQAPVHGGQGRRLSYMTMNMASRPLDRRAVEWLTDGCTTGRAFTDEGDLEVALREGGERGRGRCAAILGLWLEGRQVDRVTVFETPPGSGG